MGLTKRMFFKKQKKKHVSLEARTKQHLKISQAFAEIIGEKNKKTSSLVHKRVFPASGDFAGAVRAYTQSLDVEPNQHLCC